MIKKMEFKFTILLTLWAFVIFTFFYWGDGRYTQSLGQGEPSVLRLVALIASLVLAVGYTIVIIIQSVRANRKGLLLPRERSFLK